jgi:hypothetical protein
VFLEEGGNHLRDARDVELRAAFYASSSSTGCRRGWTRSMPLVSAIGLRIIKRLQDKDYGLRHSFSRTRAATVSTSANRFEPSRLGLTLGLAPHFGRALYGFSNNGGSVRNWQRNAGLVVQAD